MHRLASDIIAGSTSKTVGADDSYTEPMSKMVGVDVVYHLVWAESIIQLCERKSTPRDLIAEPVARILGGQAFT
eukprot:6276892-Heterocapsa_arctica.AAC.1